MTDKEAMKLALEVMKNNKPTHLYCEDIWYSCPKHEDGCANEAEGDECNCGADEINAEFDKAITAIKEALAQPEQEPVAWAHYDTFKNLGSLTRARFTATLATKNTGACCIALYTHPINQKEFK